MEEIGSWKDLQKNDGFNWFFKILLKEWWLKCFLEKLLKDWWLKLVLELKKWWLKLVFQNTFERMMVETGSWKYFWKNYGWNWILKRFTKEWWLKLVRENTFKKSWNWFLKILLKEWWLKLALENTFETGWMVETDSSRRFWKNGEYWLLKTLSKLVEWLKLILRDAIERMMVEIVTS